VERVRGATQPLHRIAQGRSGPPADSAAHAPHTAPLPNCRPPCPATPSTYVAAHCSARSARLIGGRLPGDPRALRLPRQPVSGSAPLPGFQSCPVQSSPVQSSPVHFDQGISTVQGSTAPTCMPHPPRARSQSRPPAIGPPPHPQPPSILAERAALQARLGVLEKPQTLTSHLQ
jgi:hypothetical protein